MTHLGFLLIAAGIVLEAIVRPNSVFNTDWLGGALIILGAVAILWGNIEKRL